MSSVTASAFIGELFNAAVEFEVSEQAWSRSYPDKGTVPYLVVKCGKLTLFMDQAAVTQLIAKLCAASAALPAEAKL
jgi:hypothetical protein